MKTSRRDFLMPMVDVFITSACSRAAAASRISEQDSESLSVPAGPAI